MGDTTVDFLKRKNFLQYVPKIQELLTKYPNEIIMPVDFGVDVEGKREDIELQDLPSAYAVLDIRLKTVEIFSHLPTPKSLHHSGFILDQVRMDCL